jgi:glycosyltransferase involved in cell wall biosynthesis/gas vesicle protein
VNDTAATDKPKPLTVLIVADLFPPDINGAARFAERLAGGLVRRGNTVHIVAPSTDGFVGARTESHDGSDMTVHRLRSSRVPGHETLHYAHFLALKGVARRILTEVKPDAVHIQSHFILGRPFVKVAKELGVRVLATNHFMPENMLRYLPVPGFLQRAGTRWLWNDVGRVLRQADQVTTPTRRAALLLSEKANVSNVLAISCGIDASKFANNTRISNHPPRILFLGRLDFEKHIHNLLKAVALMPRDLGVQVEIVGNGGERDHLKSLASQLGIASSVTFAGHITEEELPKAYERATVFAMPSIAELQSIATMEAMASGRPVVAADAMALPHLVHHGDNGYLFPPDDVNAFKDRLLDVLTADQAELDRLSDNSLHLIQAHDIQTTLAIFEDLYRNDDSREHESRDNLSDYTQAIGILSPAFKARVQALREGTQELRDFVDEVRDDIRERGLEVREDIKAANEKVKKAVEKVAKKLRD